MKIQSPLLLSVISIGLFFSINACSTASNNDQDVQSSKQDKYSEVPIQKSIITQNKQTTSAVINYYLILKDALVEDNSSGATEAANNLVSSLKNIKTTGLSADNQIEFSNLMEVLKEKSEHIAKNDLEQQRKHFALLSIIMIDFVSKVGFEEIVYTQYCPMFDAGNGGTWLSLSKEIRNPLFGSRMLKCGSVTQTISPI